MKRSLMIESGTLINAAFIAGFLFWQPIISFIMVPVILLTISAYYMDREVLFFARVHRLKQLVIVRRWIRLTLDEVKDW